MSSEHSQQGFTILELLVTVAIMGLLGVAVASSVEGQKRFYNTNERTIEAQEDARLVLDLIKQDTRMAGFMIPPVAAIASADGGAGAPDRLCVSDPTYFDLPTAANPITDVSFQIERYQTSNGSQVQGVSNVQVQLPSLDIDDVTVIGGQPATPDFTVGNGIIVSNGTRSHCAAVVSLFQNAPPTPSSVTFFPPPDSGVLADFTSNLTAVRAVPAIIYQVNQVPGVNGNPPQFNLTRNGQQMSSTIEDLQVEYWAPTTPAGAPVHDLNDGATGINPATISRVRLTVVSRSTQQDVATSSKNQGGYLPPLANRVAGPPDAFQRRIFTATVMPRNISTVP